MNNIKVSMAHSTQGTFASTSAWVAEADFTEVFNGTWNMPVGVGWYEVELQTPFEYNGTDNLVVSVSNAHGAYSGPTQFRYTCSTDMVLYKNSD